MGFVEEKEFANKKRPGEEKGNKEWERRRKRRRSIIPPLENTPAVERVHKEE
jgi:hypothetical protein